MGYYAGKSVPSDVTHDKFNNKVVLYYVQGQVEGRGEAGEDAKQ